MSTLSIFCPGCKKLHVFENIDKTHLINFDENKPTIIPAAVIYDVNSLGERVLICHFSLIAGMVRFYDNCAHILSGQAVQLATFSYKE